MVLQKLWVSQNFNGILRVSQHHFFNSYVHLTVLFFYTKVSWSLFFCKAKGLKVPISLLLDIEFHKKQL